MTKNTAKTKVQIEAQKKAAEKKAAAIKAKVLAAKEAKESREADKAAVKAEKESIEASKKAKAEAAANKTVETKDEANERINNFRREALGRDWTRVDLIKEAENNFDKVEVDEYNNKQISFKLNGKRVPKEGYFSVK